MDKCNDQGLKLVMISKGLQVVFGATVSQPVATKRIGGLRHFCFIFQTQKLRPSLEAVV